MQSSPYPEIKASPTAASSSGALPQEPLAYAVFFQGKIASPPFMLSKHSAAESTVSHQTKF
jgi:hypothetical protein